MTLNADETAKIYKESVLGVEPTDKRPEALEYRNEVDAEIRSMRDSPNSENGVDDFKIPHEV